VAVYLAVVAVAAVSTGSFVIRGADGTEILPILLLGFPSSVVLYAVGSWGLLPFGETASAWGGLVGLIAGSLVNVLIARRSMTRRFRALRPAPGAQG
jgi:hypothetical protein